MLCCAIVLMALLSVSHGSAIPGLSGSYRAEAILELPYAGISEPILIYYDAQLNRSRTEYYHGT
jgi:hypothetical protein